MRDLKEGRVTHDGTREERRGKGVLEKKGGT